MGISAYRIYPSTAAAVAMRCLHVDTRVAATRSPALARSRYIVILCTSGPMNMDFVAAPRVVVDLCGRFAAV